MILKLAWRQLKNRRRFAFTFALTMALGLTGMLLLHQFRLSFNQELSHRSRLILGADFAIEGRRKLTPAVLEEARRLVHPQAQLKTAIGLFTMANAGKQTRLVWLSAAEEGLPFYGKLELEQRGSVLKKGQAWVYPELKTQLGLALKQKLSLGGTTVTITDFIQTDPSQTFQIGAMAAKVKIHPADLEQTGLIRKGSTVWYRYLFKSPQNYAEFQTERIAEKLNQLLDDSSQKVLTPQTSSENMGRVLNYLNDFLGLISLVALFLAAIGLFTLYRQYLSGQQKTLAMLHALGLSYQQRFKLYAIHLLFLSLTGFILSLILVFGSTPFLLRSLSFLVDLPWSWQPEVIILGFFAGVAGSFLLGVPLLITRLRQQASLLHPLNLEQKKTSWLQTFYFAPSIVLFIALAIFLSHSFKLGLLFVLLFSAASFMSSGLFSFFLKLLRKLTWRFPFSYAMKDIQRFRTSALTIFLSLTLGSLLLTLIPTLEHSLLQEISSPQKSKLPEFFLFDIQEEQLTSLKEQLPTLHSLTPLIRARLTHINGAKLTISSRKLFSREEQQASRFRNRGINLTYRSELGPGETVIAGKYFESTFEGKGLPELSVEKRYAKRLGLKLGDRMTFTILGLPFEGRMTSLRQVRWTTFLPNFFIVFQPGVLEDAPQTYLGVLNGLSNKDQTMLQLYQNFPNISAVDVTRLITRILSVLDQMRWALRVMSWLSLVVGFFVIALLFSYQLQAKQKDFLLLKRLGLSLSQIRRMQLGSTLALSTLASSLGALLSLGAGYGLSQLFFDGIWLPPLSLFVGVVFALVGMSLFLSLTLIRFTNRP